MYNGNILGGKINTIREVMGLNILFYLESILFWNSRKFVKTILICAKPFCIRVFQVNNRKNI